MSRSVGRQASRGAIARLELNQHTRTPLTRARPITHTHTYPSQPPPEVVNLFDELVIMAEGRLVYQGPVPETGPYFARLGYPCPTNKALTDFLIDVGTGGDGGCGRGAGGDCRWEDRVVSKKRPSVN